MRGKRAHCWDVGKQNDWDGENCQKKFPPYYPSGYLNHIKFARFPLPAPHAHPLWVTFTRIDCIDQMSAFMKLSTEKQPSLHLISLPFSTWASSILQAQLSFKWIHSEHLKGKSIFIKCAQVICIAYSILGRMANCFCGLWDIRDYKLKGKEVKFENWWLGTA